MSKPQVMTTEERLKFAELVGGSQIRSRGGVAPSREDAKEIDQALLLAAEHMAAQERLNDNLSIQNANLDKKLSDVLKFARSLTQAVRVAKNGTLVGEVVALESTLADLRNALGLGEITEDPTS